MNRFILFFFLVLLLLGGCVEESLTETTYTNISDTPSVLNKSSDRDIINEILLSIQLVDGDGGVNILKEELFTQIDSLIEVDPIAWTLFFTFKV